MPFPATPLNIRIENLSIPEPNTGCWLWLGSVKNCGYGQIGAKTKDGRRTMFAAHRAAYIAFKGWPETGHVIRHTCDNKLCVNPDHLLSGTQLQNLLDMKARGREYWGKQTHCKNGHEFSPENTRQRYGENGRRCITCARLGNMRNYYRNKEC